MNWHINQVQQPQQNELNQQRSQMMHYNNQIHRQQQPQQPQQHLPPPPPPLPSSVANAPISNYPFLPPPNQMHVNITTNRPIYMNYNASSYPNVTNNTTIASNNNNNSMGIFGAPPQPLQGASSIPQYQLQHNNINNYNAVGTNSHNISYPFPPHPPPSFNHINNNNPPLKKTRLNPNHLKNNNNNTTAATTYTCSNCNNQQFPNYKALQTHQSTHKTCTYPNCNYTASPKYLSLHYSTNHNGKYSGRGLKAVSIQLPGTRHQKTFRICVGNHPDDIKLWIEERKKNFPTRKKHQDRLLKDQQQKQGNKDGEKKENCVIASLVSGYSSSSESDKDAPKTPSSPKPQIKTRLCAYYKRGKCIHGNNCKYIHDDTATTTNNPQAKQKNNNTNNKKQQKSSLLQKLVQSEIQREQYLTLQCLQFLMDEQLLD